MRDRQCALNHDPTESAPIDIRPHRRRTRIVQSYLPGGASLHLHQMGGSLGPGESAPKLRLDQFSRFARLVHYTNTPAVIARFTPTELYCISCGVSLAGVSCRRRWPPTTTPALTTLLG